MNNISSMRLIKAFMLALVVAALTSLAFTGKSGKTAGEDGGIAPDVFSAFIEHLVSDIYELEAYFTRQQNLYVPINPPFEEFILLQRGAPSTIPFTTEGFPETFLDGLLARMEYSVPVYGIWIEEDPVTRMVLF